MGRLEGCEGKACVKAKAAPKTPAKGKKLANDYENWRKRSLRQERKQKNEDEEEHEEVAGEAEDGDEDTSATGKSVPELLLANKKDIEKEPDPSVWRISEKLARAFYDGTHFFSRLGNAFTPPNWFHDSRGQFQSTVSIVKTVNSVHWKNISFQIFDIPSRGTEPFEDRYNFLQKTFGEGGTHASEQICVVAHQVATGRQHVLDKLKEVEALGGEGLMLRRPGSYADAPGLLKIKTFYDAEAVVTGHAPGKGAKQGLDGCAENFNVGSGLTDKIRQSPPKIGAIITYRFQELTRDGVPRFPSFVGIAIDKDVPKDAVIPEHRKTGPRAGGEEA
ncbi:hypothetical protein GALMADRAFT_275522 [Galerina marginata CBS 339.88]|uniref:DNA ligase OB-like domain-containing protein n=1 Tax=Galerina marginata (strain CBS 339.88) TaxID=685588 RepID=A0A067TQF8_GALM3|nr:hypothetical protein GALMADRAFT_275522 [Galerina marginata CBS 339.88]